MDIITALDQILDKLEISESEHTAINKDDGRINEYDLRRFIGTGSKYERYRLRYTEGIKYLADVAECHWLIDTIAVNRQTILRYSDHEAFGLWLLTLEGYKGTLEFKADTDCQPLIRQAIEYTDIGEYCAINPLKLYQSNGVLMLPSKY